MTLRQEYTQIQILFCAGWIIVAGTVEEGGGNVCGNVFRVLDERNMRRVLCRMLRSVCTRKSEFPSEFQVGNCNWNAPRSRISDSKSRENLTTPDFEIQDGCSCARQQYSFQQYLCLICVVHTVLSNFYLWTSLDRMHRNTLLSTGYTLFIPLGKFTV